MSTLLADGVPRTITVPNGDAQVLAGQIPQVGRFVVESVVASIDASGSGDVTPELTIQDPSGVVIATKQQTKPVAGGTTGTATWALRLTDEQESSAGGATPYAILYGAYPGLNNAGYQPFSMAITGTNAADRYAVQDLGNGATALTFLKEGVYRLTFGFRFFKAASSTVFNARTAAANYLTFSCDDLGAILQNFWASGFFSFYPFNTGAGVWCTSNLSVFGVSGADAGAAQVITEAAQEIVAAIDNVECRILVELLDPVYP